MLVTNELNKERIETGSRRKVLAEDDVRRAFGSARSAPTLKVLQTGLINPSVTYELVCGKVPHTREDFYAVNVSSLRPGNGLDNWLMSGVFWSLRQARTYIRHLKSRKAGL